jgi:hypothetical protein
VIKIPVDEKGNVIPTPEEKKGTEISLTELLKKLLEEKKGETENKIVSTIS